MFFIRSEVINENHTLAYSAMPATSKANIIKLLMVQSGLVLNLKFILCIYRFLHILQYFNCIIYIYANSCGPYAGQMVRTVKSSNLDELCFPVILDYNKKQN